MYAALTWGARVIYQPYRIPNLPASDATDRNIGRRSRQNGEPLPMPVLIADPSFTGSTQFRVRGRARPCSRVGNIPS